MNRCIIGDCREILPTLLENSVDAVVCDPPYGLSFMGKDWDHGIPGLHFWQEVIRTMKPGAHMLAFGGTRTFHRLTCAIEDAGFEIRDCLMWLYGSGFPKSLNLDGDWKGWGTALKPAWEPIILARKPFDGTVAENVQQHGCGALDIDGCRIETTENLNGGGYTPRSRGNAWEETGGMNKAGACAGEFVQPSGRWPANVIHDGSDEVLTAFAEYGDKPGSRIEKPCPAPEITGHKWGTIQGNRGPRGYADAGSAARFFYCAKASKKDREEGCEHLPPKQYSHDGRQTHIDNAYQRNSNSNHHPTVKPTALMRYLCRLVTPPGGVVLDPFMGSGSTGKAAVLEGFDFIGIEQQQEYIAIAKARIAAAHVQFDMPEQIGMAL